MMEDEQREYYQTAPNAERENRETDEERSKESEQFVYFKPNRVVEHRHYDMSLVVRKPVFMVTGQVRHKPGCTSKEDG